MYRGHQKKCLPSKEDKIFIAENAFVHCDNKKQWGFINAICRFPIDTSRSKHFDGGCHNV